MIATMRNVATGEASSDPLTWLGQPGAALADLAFRRAPEPPDPSQSRHLALLSADALQLDLSDPAQRRFGDYELLELIGEGGMGVVYRARQQSLEREVAIKLIAAGPWASRDFVDRFRSEAQNAARAQHPNIVAIYEIGTIDELHFFSMRLVRGASLALALLREGPFDAQRAARLMQTVAEAVAYAHSLDVLHLDLKPANVLLDEDGQPHVADFGLARRLDRALAIDNEEVSGTPSYMSPEQASVRRQRLTAAADVWGLGAVLYELITGQPPFRGETTQSTLKLVVDANVEPPHHRAPHLPRDLEAIILKCLRKEPPERYASAREVADDLRRFLEHREVRARPLNALQRIGRWIRREPAIAAAVALVALSLLVGLAATTFEWRRAQGNAERAESAREFLVGVFEQANPDENRGQPFTAHQLLEKGEKQIADSSDTPSATRADITALLGRLYIDVSDFKRAETLLGRAFAMLDDASIPSDVRARVLLYSAMIESENGKYDDALSHARAALALTASAAPREIANAHLVIAKSLLGRGDKAAAEAALRDSIAHDRAAIGDDNVFVADQWVQLGNVLASVGRFEESEAAFDNAVAGFTAVSGANSNGVAHTLNELSNMLEDKGDLKGAEDALNRALQIRLATVGPDHHDALAVESNLLWLLEFEGRYAESLPKRIALLDRATRAGQLHAQDHAAVLASIGKDYRELGRFAEAEAALREAIALDDSVQGPDSALSPPHWRQLGLAQTVAGHYDEADASFAKALMILRAHDPETSPTLNLVRADIGNVRRLQHRYGEAVQELRAANEMLARNANQTNTARPLALAELSEAELENGDVDAALSAATSALELSRKAYPAKHYQFGVALFALARVDLASGHADVAEPLLREALAVRSPPHPTDDLRVIEVKVALANALAATGKETEAAALRAEIEPVLRKSSSPYAADLRARLANTSGLATRG